MVKLAMILGVILCLVIISGLIQTRVIDMMTLQYKCNMTPDSKGRITLTVFHKGVKPKEFHICCDDVMYSRAALESHDPLRLVCYKSPLVSQMYIKELWHGKHRIS